ncbi:MAG: 16S rRNA (cytosine(1402)-N(4))-methyltransferase RsmH [Pseudomonadota bacterium]|nr:16S rRNA (cytosine(1402)-N(4))-methyltransferase RsmH [Pseudomonadota bacterium]
MFAVPPELIDTPHAHDPVMLREVLSSAAIPAGAIVIDGTFGRGGYARALLKAQPDCRYIALDRDPVAVDYGNALMAALPGLEVHHAAFSDMEQVTRELGLASVDVIVLDLGVSSPQIDEAERGFSFGKEGPLDMRMDPSRGPSAADVVNAMDESDLADVIYKYGEERRSRAVARAIVGARAEARIETTGQLADIVRSVVRRAKDGIDPATRTFQGLRIHVNDELGELERGLEAAERLLSPEGRLVVVSFHSLEDRIVKTFLRARSEQRQNDGRRLPWEAEAAPAREPSFTLITRKPMEAQSDESRANPRARSAKLRAASRTAAPAWSDPDLSASAAPAPTAAEQGSARP